MADLQVPPAVGSSGQRLDTVVINALSTIYRQIISVGDPATSGNMAAVDSAGNIQVVSASSGAIQVLTTGTLVVSGTVAVSPTVFSLSSGTVTLSSSPTIVSASSGVVQVLTTGTLVVSGTVNLSSGVVTLSSNPTIVSASSGVVQVLTSGALQVLTSGTLLTAGSVSTGQVWTVYQFNASSSNSLTSITTGAHVLYGWNVGNQTTSMAAAIKVYDSTSPTVGSTTGLKMTIPIPGSGNGAGNNLMLGQGVAFGTGIALVVTRDYASTSTETGHSAGDVVGAFYYV